MNIIALEAENVKAIKAVTIRPDGNLVEIAGRNDQGKSSILDAIWWALAGAKHIQAVPIRTGETKARIRLDLGEIIVERRFTESGTSLTVENAEGAQYKSPQGMLDDLLGALSFDPLAFVSQTPKIQFEMLCQTLGLDFSAVEQVIDQKFGERTDVNRRAKELHARAEGIEIVGEAPEQPVSVDDLVAKIGEAADHNADIEARRMRREVARDKISADMARAEDLRAEAQKLEDEAKGLVDALAQAGPLPDPINVDDLRQQLQDAKAKNDAFDLAKAKLDLSAHAQDLDGKSEALTAELEVLRKSKADMIAATNMPVDGLGFGDGIVTLNDVPFDQASTAKQLRASVGLAMAANPKLRVIRIMQGAFLDDDNLALIAEMAEDLDYQIWIERVDSSGKVGIVIEDGEVVAVNERAA